ncbi:MAG: ROK family protein [Clostridia bacterium]|nr:ROK family protein [Clostridia bacterium]
MKHIGIDIGGTSVKGIVVDGQKITAQTKVPTDISGGLESITKSIFQTIENLLPYVDENSGVGIGSAGDIDPFLGRVIYATDNLPGFTGFEIKKVVEERFNRRVYVVNDAVAAFIGEIQFGAAAGCDNAVMLTLGTGLGGGISVNGRILLGSNYQGARIGHIPLHPDGRACTCGLKGCAEQYVSATGLIKTAHDCGCESSDCGEIFERSSNGEAEYQKATDIFLNDMCAVIRTVKCIFDPECIVLGGGLVELKKYWWDALSARLDLNSEKLIRPAILGNMAGSMGAAYLLEDDTLITKH